MQRFGDIAQNIKPKETKAHCEHQDMMGMLKDAGFAVGKWQGMWARLLKSSRINYYDLERLMNVKVPKEYSKRGFVRNRLQNRDWVKFFDR